MKNIVKSLSILLIGGALVVYSCKKDKPDKPDDPSANMTALTLKGFVNDINGNPMSGVKVTTGTASVTTNGKGEYQFSEAEVINNRAVMRFEKEGYFTLTRSLKKRDELIIPAVLCRKGNSDISTEITFDASKGGILKVGGMKVDIPASAVVRADGSAYSGTVNADMLYLEPNYDAFSDMMPGGDLKAIGVSGSEVSIISYGMVNVLLADDAGNPLQLKSGSPADVTYPIPAKMETNAPATMPFWHFDEKKGIWIEDGVATRQGNVYVGKANHFSWHNLDKYSKTATFYINLTDPETGKIVEARFKSAQLINHYDIPPKFREVMDKLNLDEGKIYKMGNDVTEPKTLLELDKVSTGQTWTAATCFTTNCKTAVEGTIGEEGEGGGGGRSARGTDFRAYWIILCKWKDDNGKFGEYIGIYLPSTTVKEGDVIELPTIELGEGHDFTEIEEIQVIPSGKQETFTMGCADDQCKDHELPKHQVTLSPYYITKYPITQFLWETVMGENPINPKDVCYDCPIYGLCWNDIVGTKEKNGKAHDFMTIGGFTCYEDGFIYKLNKLSGKKYRLPTEAEWEYAARGGAKGKDNNHKYSGSNNIGDVAWYYDNSRDRMQKVGEKAPNELAIHDMSGLIWEWCYDGYGEYPENPQTNPIGIETSKDRVLRGGNVYSSAEDCRVAGRYRASAGYGNMNYGFRLVRVE